MREQFEQAKREFAKTYGGCIVVGFGQPSGSGGISIETAEEQCLSDLNSLLEQHKEVTLRGELEKFGTYFNEIRCPYVVTSVIDEYLKTR